MFKTVSLQMSLFSISCYNDTIFSHDTHSVAAGHCDLKVPTNNFPVNVQLGCQLLAVFAMSPSLVAPNRFVHSSSRFLHVFTVKSVCVCVKN